ncbi:MAG: hypothetical protein QOG34_1286, partial [Frankiaceae bacterium]|nr:hypothetical protein [Frankiaceae bacterium]
MLAPYAMYPSSEDLAKTEISLPPAPASKHSAMNVSGPRWSKFWSFAGDVAVCTLAPA